MKWKNLLNERFLLVLVSCTFVVYVLMNTLLVQPKPDNTDLFKKQLQEQKQIISDQQRQIDSLSNNELKYDSSIQQLNKKIDSNTVTIKKLQKQLIYDRKKVDTFTSTDISSFFKNSYGSGK